MKVVYLSNFMNHRQLPIANSLFNILGDDYKFIALEKLTEKRKQMCYDDMNGKPFVVRAYETDEEMQYAKKLINDCDVLLAGHCTDDYLVNRLKMNKPIIKTSERFFKEYPTPLNRIRQFIRAKRHLAKFQNKPFYFFCASAYTSSDVNKYTDFKDKTYKWGYFPECKHYENAEKMISKKQENSILWVGRFICESYKRRKLSYS